MSLPLLHVNAFTAAPFAGNPAAVCLLDQPAEPGWMQSVAAEVNLSATAFVAPLGDHRWSLRWYTAAVELELCGHATLATAHVLWSEGRAPSGNTLRFDTMSGELSATADDELIVLDLPAQRATETAPPPELLPALGLQPVRVGWGHMWVVEVATEAEVRACSPDFSALAALPVVVIVTAPADPGTGAAIASRCFEPAYGIDEDPVTGSAHCLLATWWAERLGTTEFTARQVSARGGELRVTLAGDRVLLGGRAVTVLRGELLH